ncbi:membrane protein insertion efficiency factor YidD [Cumulibacter soli]|uniref:membrane protein insertion efficiency factor YidD n=1 Tax=Cumulibacter soli TaxID=2546344 RepID=UPI0010688ABB|nr:membrane protein insertion efficiency factor YidD [Cumulibacter soli]
MSTFAGRLLVAPIRVYQRWISPVRPPACRFYPTCSQYAVESIQTHGAVRGSGYAIVRLLKCGPWHPGGVDKVKAPRTRSTQTFSSTATTE